MSGKTKNPNAFPISGYSAKNLNQGYGCFDEELGMSLRDYFAAKAMQGYCGGEHTGQSGMPHEMIAEWSFKMADAMLEERSKTDKS